MMAFGFRSFDRRILALPAAAAALTATLLGGSAPAAAFTVDGVIGGSDAYSTTISVGFLVTGKHGNPDFGDIGSLEIGIDGSVTPSTPDIYGILLVPTSITDNVYGAPADNPLSGWPADTKHPGKPRHPYDKLLKSDKFEFDIVPDTNTGDAFGVLIDYINDSGFGTTIDEKTGDTVDGSGLVTATATSLQWNVQNGHVDPSNSGYPGFAPTPNSPDPFAATSDPAFPKAGWVEAVQYEFRIDGAEYAARGGNAATFGLANLVLPMVLHASPNKPGGENAVDACSQANVEICVTVIDPDQVPEPAGLVLFGTGLIGLAALRRRRRAS